MALEREMMSGRTEQTDGRKQADGLTGKKTQESKKSRRKIEFVFVLVVVAAAFMHTWSKQPADSDATRGILFIADRQLITNTEEENNF